MNIDCRAWNPSEQKPMTQVRWLNPECYRDPVKATDHAINSTMIGLKYGGCTPDITTTITLPLDEYRLLISDAQKKAKEEGCKEDREEAWDLARRIVISGPNCYPIDEVNKVFGNMNIFNTPVEEVLSKDKEYQEDKKALHVGDEVEFDLKMGCVSEEHIGYITNLISPVLVRVLTKKYGTITISPERCAKTGNHSDEIEKAMASFEKGEC